MTAKLNTLVALQATAHKTKDIAARAARRALKNENAVEGEDFALAEKHGKWFWSALQGEAAAAMEDAVKKSKTKPAAKPSAAVANAAKVVKAKAETPKGKAKAAKADASDAAVKEPTGDVKKIIELALRPQGVTRPELEKLTGRTGTGWTWYLSSPKGTGIADRYGYRMSIIDLPKSDDAKGGPRKAYKFEPS